MEEQREQKDRQENQKKKTAFDAEKETDLYIPRADSARAAEKAARAAKRQLFWTAFSLIALLGAVLGGILLYQALKPAGFSGGELLEYEGLTYERLEETEDLAVFGLKAPIDEADCGEPVGELADNSPWSGTRLYQVEGLATRALLAAERNGEVALYRFCYFTEPEGRTGKDILSVITDGTALAGVDCYGKSGEWSRLLRSGEELAAFEEAFASLEPAENGGELRGRMEETGAWDATLTIRCENGLTFHLSLYEELSALAGFRTVYALPTVFLELVTA